MPRLVRLTQEFTDPWIISGCSPIKVTEFIGRSESSTLVRSLVFKPSLSHDLTEVTDGSKPHSITYSLNAKLLLVLAITAIHGTHGTILLSDGSGSFQTLSYATRNGQYARLSWSPTPDFCLLSDSCGFVDVGRPLWRKERPVIYNCWLPSAAQSLAGPRLAGLMAIFYVFWIKTTPTWRARSSYLYTPGTGWPSYTSRHTLCPTDWTLLYRLNTDRTENVISMVSLLFCVYSPQFLHCRAGIRCSRNVYNAVA
jgi:hypothetical protein